MGGAAPCCLTLWIKSHATCRDDANMKWTRLQSCRGIILTNACLLLSPSNQTMQYFTKHAIPTYTHHAGIEKKKTAPVREVFSWWVSIRTQHVLLTHQNQSGLSSGGGLWPGLPAQSLNNRCEEHLQAVWRSIFTLLIATYLSRESWYQPAQTEGPPANCKSSFLSSCLQTG